MSIFLWNHNLRLVTKVLLCICSHTSGDISQVVTLMNVDLLRHQQRWKDGLQDLRTGFATLEAQVLLTVRSVSVFAAGLHVIFIYMGFLLNTLFLYE